MTEAGHERSRASHKDGDDPRLPSWPRITQWTMFGLLGKDLSASDEKWMPRGRAVRLIGQLTSMVAFFPLAVLVGIATSWCLDFLGGTTGGLTRLERWIGSEDVVLAALIAFIFFLAYMFSRAIFVLIAFRLTSIRGRCSQCLYDLTGNVSGVCPECGTKVVER